MVLPMMKVPRPQTRQWSSSPPPATYWPLLVFLRAPITTGTTPVSVHLSLDGDRGHTGLLPNSIFLSSLLSHLKVGGLLTTTSLALSSHIGLFLFSTCVANHVYDNCARSHKPPGRIYPKGLAAILWSHVVSKSPLLLTRRSLRPSTFVVTLCRGAPLEYPSAARKGDPRRRILESWTVLRGEGGMSNAARLA